MAKFSKGQYVVLMRALSLARHNVLEEAQAVAEDNEYLESPRDTNSYSKAVVYWGKYGVMTAAKYVADAMALDNPAFDREHFLEVVKGNRKADSRPDKPITWGEPTQASHK